MIYVTLTLMSDLVEIGRRSPTTQGLRELRVHWRTGCVPLRGNQSASAYERVDA
jgi:hypothetical protein